MPLSLLPYVLVLVMAVGSLAAAGYKGYQLGRDSRAEEVGQLRMAADRSRQAALAAEDRAREEAQRVRVEYRDRIKVVTQKAEAEVRLVEVVKREVDPNCTLPPSFRRLWDGEPAPGDVRTEGPDGDAVPLADVATATAEAKKRFEENRAQLDALISLVRSYADNHKQD